MELTQAYFITARLPSRSGQQYHSIASSLVMGSLPFQETSN